MKKTNQETPVSLPQGISTVGQLSYQTNQKTLWTQQSAIVSKDGQVVLIPFHSVKLPSSK